MTMPPLLCVCLLKKRTQKGKGHDHFTFLNSVNGHAEYTSKNNLWPVKCHENNKISCKMKVLYSLEKNMGRKSSGLGGRLIVVVRQ